MKLRILFLTVLFLYSISEAFSQINLVTKKNVEFFEKSTGKEELVQLNQAFNISINLGQNYLIIDYGGYKDKSKSRCAIEYLIGEAGETIGTYFLKDCDEKYVNVYIDPKSQTRYIVGIEEKNGNTFIAEARLVF